jgi:ribosome-associated protein
MQKIGVDLKNEKFKVRGDYIELFKLLKITGACDSGGAAKFVIAEGHVKVDGVVETRKACKIRLGQKVEYLENTIEVE